MGLFTVCFHNSPDLDGEWNKEPLPHGGRHPIEYHNWIPHRLEMIDKMSNGNTDLFLNNFELYIKEPVRANPSILYKDYWLSVKSIDQ